MNEDSPSSKGDKKHITKNKRSAKAPAISAGKAEQDTQSSSSDYSAGEDEAFHDRFISPSNLRRTRPHSSGSEPIMVTNANRDDFIQNYIAHLTHFTGTSFQPDPVLFSTGM